MSPTTMSTELQQPTEIFKRYISLWSFGAAAVQWNSVRSGDLGIPEYMGSNPGHGLRENWASTLDNGSQMGGFSQIGGLQ